jgi:uncharacterized protein (DUF2141 family)
LGRVFRVRRVRQLLTMRFCSKCGDFYADRLLAFCPADGMPLIDVDPSSDLCDQATRVIEQKQNALKTQQRRLKWRRAMLGAMLMATMVVTVLAVTRSISITVDRPRGELCIGTFNDLNGNGGQDTGEPGLSGFVFQVSGTDPATTLTTGPNGDCKNLPPGTYTVVEQPQSGWTATTPTTQTVSVTAGQTVHMFFGIQKRGQDGGKLCIGTFNDLNGNHAQDAGEPGLSGFVFQVSGTGAATTLTTDLEGGVCSDLPVGTYTVVETPKPGWIATPPTTQIVTVIAGQTLKVSFGSRQENELCVSKFDDLNGNGVQDAGEAGVSGFVFQLSGTGRATTLTTGPNGVGCVVVPVGTYTVVEQPQSGWIATTRTTQTVAVTAGQPANVFFGRRQAKGKLCIRTFDDRNGNRGQDAGEPGLSGFVFQVSGTGSPTTLTTDSEGGACSDLPVGTYTVVETPKPGWISISATKQTVTLAANQVANLFFGSRANEKDPACSDADKSLEMQIITHQYKNTWRKIIEGERAKIIAENVPPGIKAEASLGPIDYKFPFPSCTAVDVVLGYEWLVQSPVLRKTVRKERKFVCAKIGGVWICH